MKKKTLAAPEAPGSDLDLGAWLGRRQAFGMMAGTASAADVQCLKKIRDSRVYKRKCSNWNDFCVRYVGVSKPQVDRAIKYLEDFGPSFFALTHLTRISPDDYRAIAGHVTPEGLLLDDATIPLTPDNGQQLAAAVVELRQRALPAPGAPIDEAFAAASRRLESAIAGLQATPAELPIKQKQALADQLVRAFQAGERLGITIVIEHLFGN